MVLRLLWILSKPHLIAHEGAIRREIDNKNWGHTVYNIKKRKIVPLNFKSCVLLLKRKGSEKNIPIVDRNIQEFAWMWVVIVAFLSPNWSLSIAVCCSVIITVSPGDVRLHIGAIRCQGIL